ncbi:ABC transporter ATP-binding protein [Streptomyces sp. CC228A]|uniref:ABC transporter ATP-binding protein n=1 Tax=Streptomyces sp. CC228A TaxID=2898186 RepID=UPI001F210A6A|nr:ATP-binding cassette domain-containing protein [Streptomyces sp. CC228A]
MTTGPALEAVGLGKAYRRRDALRDCSFRLPYGRVCALVGPNGAGKSTLLALAAGVLRPGSGALRVLGTDPASARERIAYVSQDKPLYPQLSVRETLRMGAELNPRRWDGDAADAVAAPLDPASAVRSLSGGQRTRLALALALGKRPELLLLDEPMADLDPLARHQLMGALMADAAERGTTVVMSSHILTELEGACDHLLLLDGGRIRLGGAVDGVLGAHTVLTGPAAEADRALAPYTVVEARTTGRQTTALVRNETGTPPPDSWQATEPSLEELLLSHLRAPGAPALLDAETAPAREGLVAA